MIAVHGNIAAGRTPRNDQFVSAPCAADTAGKYGGSGTIDRTANMGILNGRIREILAGQINCRNRRRKICGVILVIVDSVIRSAVYTAYRSYIICIKADRTLNAGIDDFGVKVRRAGNPAVKTP